jgi:hypothetical protein
LIRGSEHGGRSLLRRRPATGNRGRTTVSGGWRSDVGQHFGLAPPLKNRFAAQSVIHQPGIEVLDRAEIQQRIA